MLYKRVWFDEDGNSEEGVHFVGVHPIRWYEIMPYVGPQAAFAEIDFDMDGLKALYDFVKNLATNSCCQTEGCSTENPVCEVSEARALLIELRDLHVLFEDNLER